MTECKTVESVERAYRNQIEEVCGEVDREDYECFCEAYEDGFVNGKAAMASRSLEA